MPALLGVRSGAAPVLLEEHPKPFLRAGQVRFGIQGAEHRIVRDALVEAVHEPPERLVPADGVVEGLDLLTHGPIVARAGDSPLSRSAGVRGRMGIVHLPHRHREAPEWPRPELPRRTGKAPCTTVPARSLSTRPGWERTT